MILEQLFMVGISGGPVFLSGDTSYVTGLCKGYYTSIDNLSACVRITQNMVDLVNSLN